MAGNTTELDDGPDRSRSWIVALLTVIAAAVIVIAILLAVGTFDDDAASTSTTSGTAPSASTSVPTSTSSPATTPPATTTPVTASPATTTPATTTPATTGPATTAPSTTAPAPTTAPPPVDPTRNAIFPTPGMSTNYTDPVDVARDFALAIGYTDPVTGEFRAGDSRSGEVEIRAAASSPPSIVLVRQFDDQGGWYVIGAATDSIEVDTPEPLEVLTSPLEVSGRARAFEGTVEVLLQADDAADALVDNFVTGSGGAELGPFEGSFEFEPPIADGGALLFLSRSSEDGSVTEVGALRIFFEAD